MVESLAAKGAIADDVALRARAGALGIVFMRLFGVALASKLWAEAEELVAGAQIFFPDLNLAETRIQILFCRHQFAEAERLLGNSQPQWALPWIAILAIRRNDPAWRDIADRAIANGSAEAKALVLSHWPAGVPCPY
jgi:hypothetical protein